MKIKKKIKQPKIHKLQSTWENQGKAKRVEMWRVLNGKTDHELVPLSIFQSIYSGDLMYSLREHLIEPRQSWHLQCKILARNEQTGEEVHVDYAIKSPERMTLWQFLEGFDDEHPDEFFYIDQGGGIKTRWEGHNHELEKYLDSVGDDDYLMISNHSTLTCWTQFKSAHAAMMAQMAKAGLAYESE